MRSSLLTTLAVVATLAVGAPSRGAESVEYALNIERQVLSRALQEFAKQTGVQIIFFSEVTDGYEAPPISGKYTAAAALSRLLDGSELTYREINAKTIEVQLKGAGNQSATGNRAGAYQRVSQSQNAQSIENKGSGSAAEQAENMVESANVVTVFGTMDNRVSVGSKTGLSLRETPKSVTIVTRERIEAQNLTTIAGVMKQATGVTVRDYGPFGGWFFSRGYRVITSQVDGGAPITDGFGSTTSPDSAIFDSVEVLRGVDGLFSGAGDPGGVINLVRKRALRTPGLEVNVSAGRWSNYRAEADLTGPLALDGRVRGRAVGVYEDRGYHLDGAATKKAVIYGVLETDIGSATVLSVGGVYEHVDNDRMDLSGLPFYPDGRSIHLPRDTNLASDWSYHDFRTKEVFAKMEHTFANDWVLKANASRMEQDADNLSLFVRGPVDPATGIIQGTGATGATVIAASRHPTRTTLDVFVNGKFQLFSQQHSFAIGADYSKMNGDGQVDYKFSEYPASARRPVDVFNFNPADFARPTNRLVSFTTPVSNQAQSGVYATLGLQLADPLRLIVGARYSNYEIQSQNYYADAAGVLPDQPSYGANYREHALVPSAALTYEITPNWSAYVSYAQSFNPQANLLTAPLPGTPMSAITGEGYELGVKGTAFDNLNVSLSVYRVLRNGEGISDPAYPYTPGEGGSACCYVAMGDAITRGLDLEFSGTILPGWQLFAGYTYNEREANAASANEFLGTALYFNWTPKHLFKTWTTWNLPGSWSKWTLNAGVQAQTQFSGYGFPTPLPHQAGYAIWNASVQYRVSDSWSVALYAENLFDKTYYEAMSTVRNEGLYGVPRNLILRMQYKFN